MVLQRGSKVLVKPLEQGYTDEFVRHMTVTGVVTDGW